MKKNSVALVMLAMLAFQTLSAQTSFVFELPNKEVIKVEAVSATRFKAMKEQITKLMAKRSALQKNDLADDSSDDISRPPRPMEEDEDDVEMGVNLKAPISRDLAMDSVKGVSDAVAAIIVKSWGERQTQLNDMIAQLAQSAGMSTRDKKNLACRVVKLARILVWEEELVQVICDRLAKALAPEDVDVAEQPATAPIQTVQPAKAVKRA